MRPPVSCLNRRCQRSGRSDAAGSNAGLCPVREPVLWTPVLVEDFFEPGQRGAWRNER